MAATSAIHASKKALRKAMYAKLRAVSEAEIKQQSDAVLGHLIASPLFQRSKSINCFLSIQGEIDTNSIVHEILRSGKNLYVPKTLSSAKESKHMDMFQIYTVADLESLPSGVWGIREPEVEVDGKKRPSALVQDGESLDLILAPGMAFDNTFARLGHGGGYYDRFLTKYNQLCKEKGLKRPVIGLHNTIIEQILPPGEIPMSEFDHHVDLVVTPDGFIGDVEKVLVK